MVVRVVTEETLLSGLTRRLAWITAGAALVSGLSSVFPGWVALIVLAIWYVPLVWHTVFCDLIAAGAVMFMGLVGRSSWRLIAFVLAAAFEQGLVAGTFGLLAGSLL
jgi:hypothetical protein